MTQLILFCLLHSSNCGSITVMLWNRHRLMRYDAGCMEIILKSNIRICSSFQVGTKGVVPYVNW